MKAAILKNQRKPLDLEDLSIPIAGPKDILIRVEACGICHSDLHLADGEWDFNQEPRVPGHEVVGTVYAMGQNVTGFREGERVGLPWIYSTCKRCLWCKKGDAVLCNQQQVTGVTVDGGFAEFVKAPASSVIRVPSALSPEQAAPLFCAGLTAYAGLKLAHLKKGEWVGIHGLGGLGHLALQLALWKGAKTITITRSKEKADLALKLGSDHVVNLAEKDPIAGLNEFEGVDAIFSSSINPVTLGRLIPALRPNGRLIIAGAGRGSFQVSPVDLIARRIRIVGTPVGNQEDLAEVLKLGAEGKIKAMVEPFPLERVNEALNRLRQGKVRFRAVLIF